MPDQEDGKRRAEVKLWAEPEKRREGEVREKKRSRPKVSHKSDQKSETATKNAVEAG